MSLQDTPHAMRLHIGLFGRRNSGKSSLLNALTGQSVAAVSSVPGTTTDPVYKAMELPNIGPVVFIDTAGFDDEGRLGALRVEKTAEVEKAVDIALLLFSDTNSKEECARCEALKKKGIPVLPVLSRIDERENAAALAKRIEAATGMRLYSVSAKTGQGIDVLRTAIAHALPEDFGARRITAGVCESGSTVLLVMPQDIQAPKGRLILPQVQTLRELLDRKCLVYSCTTDKFPQMLASLAAPPHLIITDSQVFREVHKLTPAGTRLTSFSILFSAYKGDVDYFKKGAEALVKLPPHAHILIAEACTHKPLHEDIGRVKLPRLLRKRLGASLHIDITAGKDFPKDLAPYDLIIHCGSCMFNRAYVLSRVEEAKAAKKSMTNYGMAIAALLGILDDVEIPTN